MTDKHSIGELMRCGSTALVAVTYGTDGQLTQKIISGPEIASECISEEGLYILYRKRGIQIATVCERRSCSIAQICRCSAPGQNIHTNLDTRTQSGDIPSKDTIRKSLYERIVSWLRLYQAAHEIRSSELCFLVYPRTLSWGSIFDNDAFQFDHDLEEHYSSIRDHATTQQVAKESPSQVIEFISDAWRQFVENSDYCSEKAMRTPRRGSNEYHIVDRDIASGSSGGAKTGESRSEGDERSAPVIIPPRDMRVGRSLEEEEE
ncbi:hypothetical protein RRF57_007590 [Xylaria bambusicola]|uniref:Uncharacterized protein n=1 Tax=Xylaria bambusicola TaxID=326684 RepID=A0AAN7US93_9PEZI